MKKTTNPLVSILMPVYNSFDFVRSEGRQLLPIALNSLLAQSYKNIQILILDNMSTDDTSAICKKYAHKDKRVQYILDSKKRYPEGAITKLGMLAKGKYCMIANDDDLWEPSYVEELVHHLENNDNIDLCYANARTIDIDGKKSNPLVGLDGKYSDKNDSETNYLKFVSKRNIIPIAFGIYRTSTFQKTLPFHKFDKLKANVDNLFLIKFFLNGGKSLFVDRILFYYRKKERKLDPSKIEGMPTVDMPIDIFLYYANHQLNLYKEINKLINKSKQATSQESVCKIWAMISTIKFSINLLGWVKEDIAKDHKHQVVISKILSKFGEQSIPTYINPSLVPVSSIDQERVDALIMYAKDLAQKYRSLLQSLMKYSTVENIDTNHKFINDYDSALSEITIMENSSTVKKYEKKDSHNPIISVIITSYNLSKYLKETIDSVLNQSIKKLEIIIVDGYSTDGSIDIIKKYVKEYPDLIKFISEPDTGYPEAFWKGIRLSKGKYIAQCAVSDAYASFTWLESSCDFLEKNNCVSLVWGLAQYMDEKSNIGIISYPDFHENPAPSGVDFYKYWLKTGFYFPEGNLVVNKKTLEKCYPKLTELDGNTLDWLEFSYRFNNGGYLSQHLSVIANYGRVHYGQKGEELNDRGRLLIMIKNYKNEVALHKFRKLINQSMTFICPNNIQSVTIKIDPMIIFAESLRTLANYMYPYYTKVKNALI